MRIFNCNKLKWNKISLIAYILVIIASIICGIVLYILNNISIYIYEFANTYVLYVFNFNSWKLFIYHFLAELVYLYLVFFLSHYGKLKFLVYPAIFIRTLFLTLYTIILCAFFGTEGIIVALIVFIPSFLFSFVFMVILAEQCKNLCKPFAFFCPAVLALINSIILLLLVNVVFRVIVVIV